MVNEDRTKAPSTKLNEVPWWALIIAAAGLIILYQVMTDLDYRATFIFIKDGVIVTLRIAISAFLISTVIGLPVGLMRTSKSVLPYTISTLYVEIVRGIPMVVLILMVAFGIIPLFIELINAIGAWGVAQFSGTLLAGFFQAFVDYSIREIPMELRAIIALAVGYGAFEAEIFRSGIQSIGKGQMEAARSLGMTYMQSMRFVILPQAIRRVLPPLGNDFIAMLKDSSLATVLAVNEVTQLTRIRRASTFRVMEAFNIAAFLYLAMTLLLSAGVRFLEKRMKVED
jgi:polar amino acid transport system permease protein